MNSQVEQLCNIWKTMDREFVSVDETRLNQWIARLADEVPAAPNYSGDKIFPKDNHVFVNHILYSCAVNFCFWLPDPNEKYEVDGFTGAMAMQRCFYRQFGENHISPHEMLSIVSSQNQTENFFRGKNLPQLLEERRIHLLEIATVLRDSFEREAEKILWTGNYQALEVVDVLANCFPIVFRSDPKFLKRAQLFALMYQARALDKNAGIGSIPSLLDFEDIGPIVDYQIPRALRNLGILKYASDLANRIDSYREILKDSEEEFEIRLATNYVMSEMLQKMKKWTMIELDHWLLMLGKKSPQPHHRTLTTCY